MAIPSYMSGMSYHTIKEMAEDASDAERELFNSATGIAERARKVFREKYGTFKINRGVEIYHGHDNDRIVILYHGESVLDACRTKDSGRINSVEHYTAHTIDGANWDIAGSLINIEIKQADRADKRCPRHIKKIAELEEISLGDFITRYEKEFSIDWP